MTKQLYMEDSYTKEADAVVKSVTDKFIVLDQSIFYPNGGGQPSDSGKLIKDGEEFNVVFAKKIGQDISLEVDKEGLKQGDRVKQVLDWDRRLKLMRMHTAAHIVSGIFHNAAKAKITGNQLDIDKTRIDFDLENFDREKIDFFIANSNKIVEADFPIKIYSIPRAEAEQDESLARLTKGLPEGIQEIRIVDIEGFDRQADGGTHVKSTAEVGKIVFLKADNKGAARRRVYFTLE